jgi:hypothetical protein
MKAKFLKAGLSGIKEIQAQARTVRQAIKRLT